MSSAPPSTLPLTLKTREESPSPQATAASINPAAPTPKPEEKLPPTPSSHPVMSDDALWAYNSGAKVLQHLPTFGPVHHYDAGSTWAPITIESPLLPSLRHASSQHTMDEHSPAGRTVSRGDFSSVVDLHSLMILPSSQHSSIRRQLSGLPRQLSSLSPKSLHDSSMDVFSRPGPNPLKRTLSPDTPCTSGREKLSRSIFGRQPWPATSPGMVARTLSPTHLAGNVITTGMAVFAWVSDDSTSGDCSDDSSKNSTSGHPNGNVTPLREQHSVQTGVKFELEAQQVVSTEMPQMSVRPAERPVSCHTSQQEQCRCAVLHRQISDKRQIYVLAE